MANNSLAPAIRELEKAWEALTEPFYEYIEYWHDDAKARFVKPVISIESRRAKRGARGWFNPATWESESNKALGILAGKKSHDIKSKSDEMVFAAEELHRSKEEIMGFMVHLMVHQVMSVLNKHGVSKTGYHNEVFRDIAQRFGLSVENTYDGKGWMNTKLSWTEGNYKNAMQLRVEKHVMDMTAFDMYRSIPDTLKMPGSKIRKWACPKCEQCVRASSDIAVICKTCGINFEYADKDKFLRKYWERNRPWGSYITWSASKQGLGIFAQFNNGTLKKEDYK